jgi:hypothetical protein
MITSGDGKRPDCASCHLKGQRNRRSTNILDVTIYDMASGILRRTSGKGKRNGCYVKNGIKCLIGSTRNEVIEYLNLNFRGEIASLIEQGISPSVDRIDPQKSYEDGNLRIISTIDNARLGVLSAIAEVSKPIMVTYPDGTSENFSSIKEAGKRVGCKRDTIYAALKRPWINRRGLRFELIEKA